MNLSEAMRTYVKFYNITKDELARRLRQTIEFIDITFDSWWNGNTSPKTVARRSLEKFFNPFLWENFGERLEFPAIRWQKGRKRGRDIKIPPSRPRSFRF